MGEVKVLMVAEKPSIADTVSRTLGQDVIKRKGVSPNSPVFEYRGHFKGQPAHFKVTGTAGHVFSLDFGKEYNDWHKHGPQELFRAETIRTYDARSKMPEHLQEEARGCDVLVLWLDCDREGENICFEVMGEALPAMTPRWSWPEAFHGCVYRAHFSSLAAQDLIQAMEHLSVPNENESKAVDARQEIDLRVGVAFSRFQTQYFRQHFGRQLGKCMVTYGPCQTPTLWFCVKRHAEIQAFVPVPYWRIKAMLSLGGSSFSAEAARGAIWNEQEAIRLRGSLNAGSAIVASRRTFQSVCTRPLPLNTVTMLQMASDELGIGPGDALHIAEQLYLKGITSYPRTETDKYPENFDLKGTLVRLTQDAGCGEYAQALLHDGGLLTAPRTDGVDAGDHPPITPVRSATQAQCGGQAGWLIYQAICCNFLASLSPDALFNETEVKLKLGAEPFVAHSSRCVRRGWLEVRNLQTRERGDVDLGRADGLVEGALLPVVQVDLSSHYTQPPGHLTESELLGLMETHGIGTDASMATHVSNVCKRDYVALDESSRQMRPTPLGLALAHGFTLIDEELVLPTVRASIENACTRIAKGRAKHREVVAHALRIFERKFVNYCRLVDRLPLMLAIAFSKQDGRPPAGGASAAAAEELWAKSAKMIEEVSLDALLRLRENVDLPTAAGTAEEEDVFSAEEAAGEGEGVRQAQRVLEELGFGAPEAPNQRGARSGGRSGQGHGPPAVPEPPGLQNTGVLGHLRPGDAVRITGLTGAVQLNGIEGMLQGFDGQAQRWHVVFPDGDTKAIKEENLEGCATGSSGTFPSDSTKGSRRGRARGGKQSSGQGHHQDQGLYGEGHSFPRGSGNLADPGCYGSYVGDPQAAPPWAQAPPDWQSQGQPHWQNQRQQHHQSGGRGAKGNGKGKHRRR